jgi:tripartite-type tricarboxylate transporter receptor subunit TctC
MPSSGPHVQSGKLVPLAQTQKLRAKNYPNLPTMEEAGYPGFEVGFWYGLAGPKALPAELIQQINADVNKVLAMPDVVASFERSGAGDGGGTPQKLAGMIDADLRKWAKVIKDANVKPDA